MAALRTPERSLSPSKARGGVHCPPQAAPKLRLLRLPPPGVDCFLAWYPGFYDSQVKAIIDQRERDRAARQAAKEAGSKPSFEGAVWCARPPAWTHWATPRPRPLSAAADEARGAPGAASGAARWRS